MKYGELAKCLRTHERDGSKTHLTAYITFSGFGTDKKSYPNRGRTYAISSDNKAYRPHMGGYSIFGTALDGTDSHVRLDQYMQEEHGGEDGWAVEGCCILAYLLTTVNERDVLPSRVFFSREAAFRAMVEHLTQVAGYDVDTLWEAVKNKQSIPANDDYDIGGSGAWLNVPVTGNWDWNIQMLRIYGPDRIEMGDVEDE